LPALLQQVPLLQVSPEQHWAVVLQPSPACAHGVQVPRLQMPEQQSPARVQEA